MNAPRETWSERFGQLWAKRKKAWIVVQGFLLLWLAFLIEHKFHANEQFHDFARAFWVSPQPPNETAVPITIVRLTGESISNRTDRIPYPRDVLAKVVNAVARYSKPRVICLDVFLEPPQTGGDDQLVKALTNLTNGSPVFLAQGFRIHPGGPVPIPILEYFSAASKGHGVTMFERDEDLVVRSAVMKLELKGSNVESPTLPALLAEHLNGTKLDALPERIPVHFPAAPEALFRFVNADGLLRATTTEEAQLISQAIPTGAVVIIGPFHDEAHDILDVPVMPGVTTIEGQMPGATLLAYTLRSLLSASPPRMIGGWTTVLVCTVLLVGSFLAWFLHTGRLAVCLLWVGYLGWAFWSVSNGQFWPVAIPTICWLFGWHFGHSMRYELRDWPESHGSGPVSDAAHGHVKVPASAAKDSEGAQN